MEISLYAFVYDCPDPMALARFYAAVLDIPPPRPTEDEWVDLPIGDTMLSFQRVENYQPPDWPDGYPQQAHLDFEVPEYGDAHDWVVELGAVPLDPTGPVGTEDGRGFRVYADPAGHPFCLCLPS